VDLKFGKSSRQAKIIESIADPHRTFGGLSFGPELDQKMRDDIYALAQSFASIVNAVRAAEEDHRPTQASSSSNKVFIVHGHDHITRDLVASHLLSLGLEPVILQDQASRGRTIVEKFEMYADVAFAVILLTADDFGGANADGEALKRARQNVVLELGYFFGRLGRENVALLHEDAVELPSDVSGMVYIPLANDAWKDALGVELTAAGLIKGATRSAP
ncbi:MAG: nucleotide-binding protein, partial [Pseudomonadota bacterium]